MLFRSNIVVTRDKAFRAEGATIAHGFDEALAVAQTEHPPAIMVIGGSAIFAAALPIAHRLELTEVETAPDGDAFMPPYDKTAWREVARDGPHESNGLRYSYVTLERR